MKEESAAKRTLNLPGVDTKVQAYRPLGRVQAKVVLTRVVLRMRGHGTVQGMHEDHLVEGWEWVRRGDACWRLAALCGAEGWTDGTPFGRGICQACRAVASQKRAVMR